MQDRFLLLGLVSFLWVTPLGAAEKSITKDKLSQIAHTLYDDVQHHQLANGLNIYLKPIAGDGTVTTMVAYRVGAADEELDQTGLSHYLEHLMFKGTDKLMPGDIDRITQKNGGRNNAYTSEDMTVYHFDFAADRWTIALEIEADRMRNLRIDTKHEFEQEKGAVLSELDGNEDEPWDLEHKAILPLLFGPKAPYGHPIIGEKAHVRAATAEIIKKHYDRWYHPNNAYMVVVGGFDPKEALEKIQKLFGPIPKANLPERKTKVENPVRKEIVRHKMPSKFDTPKILFGFNTVPSSHPDSYALDVLQSVLTGGKTGRLYQKLIEEDRSCVEVITGHSSGRYPGWFSIQAELLKDQLPKVEKTILGELEKVADKGITPEELKRIQRSLIAGFIFNHESAHEIADNIASSVATDSFEDLKQYLPKIMAVTSADVQRVTKQYLIEQKPVVVWSIPTAEPEKQDKSHRTKSKSLTNSGRLFRKEKLEQGASSFSLKNTKRVVLENGLTVLLLENHRMPIVVVQAAVKDVLMREPADKAGVAGLVGTMLDEGTAKRSSLQIAEAIEDLGASMSMNSTGGSLKILPPDVKSGLEIFFECLISPTFPGDPLEAKRELILSQIEEELAKPSSQADLVFHRQIYPANHPFARSSLGEEEIVKQLTAKDCKDFHAAVFRPNNTVLSIVGDFNSEEVLKQIKHATAKWASEKLPDLPKYDFKKPEKYTEKILSDADSAQLYVYLGHIGIQRINPDYYKLLVMDNVLGTGPGFTDRLSSSLRDRQGLAYSVSATITANAGDQPGTFTGYIGTFPDKFQAVKDGFLKEIRRIREEVPDKEEVDNAKLYLIGSQPFRLTTNQAIAIQLISIERYGLGWNYLDEFRKQIEAVTPEDVKAVAQKYLDPERLILVASGPIDAKGKVLKKE